ncbi:hypothetical protein TSA1_24310 [Bradyrhizobium nitroreducens]|uniref:Uncharacterized protein n=2 Tax=Bradyrhizobium nitroreducens TaxID=709803 RepID=A0A2M6UG02_9BRAD|nr:MULTISPECIES: hypothetical protein [Bradyrhizobium]PIT03544.1 hypothetical protein TSA1_24310 [Bradyrhizobium nitroreducens]TQF27921.1 hypothetical protein UNPF46_28395 [Bradyrhizobium sp. UNPF46]
MPVLADERLLSDGDRFELRIGADRSTFVLRSKSDFFTARLEGEHASRFEADYRAVRQRHPALKPDQALAQLWDNDGYMWYAAQEAD